MDCPTCGQTNPVVARFCGQCGGPLILPVACGTCGRENAPGQRFCHDCGTRLDAAAAGPREYTPAHLADKILRERAGLEGERRVVTVLFADAAGSVAMGERLDPEDVYGLMQDCLARMMDAVHRYEGTVTQFRGDGVMALFGAPIAHEDSARRAVAAAVDIQRALADHLAGVRERLGVECRFRVGLNTGPVVVGKIGDDLVMDYTALGDTVNLAARMEGAAEPGTVYLAESTYRVVADYFECEPVGRLVLKGKSEPVAAYRILGAKPARTRFEVATARGLTPFVGREQELAVLDGFLERARGGNGQVVIVSGDAGIGKSRLLFEWRAKVGSSVDWLEGHCISYGKSIAYLPLVDVLKAAFGVGESDEEPDIVGKIDASAAGWSPDWALPYYRFLLNVDPGDPSFAKADPLERRAGIFDALRALVAERSRRRPLVIAVEDAHWMDEASDEALRILVDVVRSCPAVLVLTTRPGYAHGLGDHAHLSRIALANLAAEETAEMAAGVLRSGAVPPELGELIARKAEGNRSSWRR